MFQDSFVLPRESVARNAALPLRMRGEGRGSQIDAVGRVLDGFGLLPVAEQPAGTLSGGERQRTAVARAVVGRPAVILADEPTGSLDADTGAGVMEMLVDLHRSGVTVVVITHSAEVAAIADRCIRLADGRIDSDTGAASSGGPHPVPPAADSAPTRSPRPRRRSGWLFGDAVSSLLLSPARTVGVLAAFVIAVAGLVTSVGMSATAAGQVSQRLDAAALDQVVARLPDTSTREDLRRAAASIASLDGVLAAGARTTLAATAARPGRWIGGSEVSSEAPVLAVDADFLDVELASVAPATAAAWLDVEDGVPVALLGAGAAEDLGIPTTRTGDTLRIDGQSVVVAGFVLSSPRDPALGESILVSATDFAVPPQSEHHVVARTTAGRPAAIAESVPLAVDPGHPETVVVQTVADLRRLTRG
ncbi:ATP-binding cassette domain-containing protein [Rathayibacter oskolensis]|uniref:ATP-binding cassette domain-containing protein n=1 Tax=Rathayibacter oskolensis TaxID=1891671 RepID=UPI002660303C|nr:ATP-binding cassette domain-containing protein [Rathayibacter oskolensis]WKK70753.1 ATP-binding cassette domain-containing protein [Rathayibacter oskolensis]